MNNEPAAWGMFVDGDFWDAIHNDEHNRVEGEYTVPLYTHPADLTDGEIFEIAKEFMEHEYPMLGVKWVIPDAHFVDFARAILRKAQEK